MAGTSRLDAIVEGATAGGFGELATPEMIAKFNGEVKQEIKLLFLEVIGEDRPYVIEHKGKTLHLDPERVDAQNDLRAELRQLVEAL